jgi:hypothetical protein
MPQYSYIKVIYGDCDTIVIASPDLSGRSNLVEGLGMAGKIVFGIYVFKYRRVIL